MLNVNSFIILILFLSLFTFMKCKEKSIEVYFLLEVKIEDVMPLLRVHIMKIMLYF